jgi:DNA-binding transcriptional MerR regulator
MEEKDEYLTSGYMCRRYNVSVRTIDRWLEEQLLPEPIRIKGRRYWLRSTIEESERNLAGKAAQAS